MLGQGVVLTESRLLLQAYYEILYEWLSVSRDRLIRTIEQCLPEELSARNFAGYTDSKYDAYQEACLAFVEERLEAYNPIGIQYTFDHARSETAAQLEFQLDWFDSRVELRAGTEDMGALEFRIRRTPIKPRRRSTNEGRFQYYYVY